MVTIADSSAILTEVYHPRALVDLLTRKRILSRHIKEGDPERFDGDEVIIPLRIGRNQGIGARLEDVALPAADRVKHQRAKYDIRYLYVGIQLTGPAMHATKNKVGAIVDLLSEEMAGAMDTAEEEVQRQWWADGSGILTQCGVTSAANTVVVSSTKYLERDMKIDVLTIADGTAVVEGRTIVSIDSGTTFTISGAAITTSASHGIWRSGTRDPTSSSTWNFAPEPWGLEALLTVDDSLLASHGITGADNLPGKLARATEDKWRAGYIDHSGDNLAESHLREAYDEADIKADDRPELVLTNHGGRNAAAALLQGNRRYVNQMQLEGGFLGVEFNGIGIFADKDAHRSLTPGSGDLNRFYFLNLDSFRFYVQQNWDWLPAENGVLRMKVSGGNLFDTWLGYLYSYQQLAVEHPKQNVVLDVAGDSAGVGF